MVDTRIKLTLTKPMVPRLSCEPIHLVTHPTCILSCIKPDSSMTPLSKGYSNVWRGSMHLCQFRSRLFRSLHPIPTCLASFGLRRCLCKGPWEYMVSKDYNNFNINFSKISLSKRYKMLNFTSASELPITHRRIRYVIKTLSRDLVTLLVTHRVVLLTPHTLRYSGKGTICAKLETFVTGILRMSVCRRVS